MKLSCIMVAHTISIQIRDAIMRVSFLLNYATYWTFKRQGHALVTHTVMARLNSLIEPWSA